MTNSKASIFGVIAYVGILLGPGIMGSSSQGAEPVLDVNDVSFLWPPPEDKEAVAALISVDEKNAAGTSELWPKKAFDTIINAAESVAVTTSAGTQARIDFRPFKAQFSQIATWKVVAVRVDPSAPGCDPKMIALFGSVPQIRLIVQPVTVTDAGAVTVHDLSAHIVYSFIKGLDDPAIPGGPKRFVPDKEKFAAIVAGLKALKTAAGVPTSGPLGVHPGLKEKTPGFAEKLRDFLRQHLSEQELSAVAFMGIEATEPWIFFSMSKQKDGTFGPAGHPTLHGANAQMLTFLGGTPVMPVPITANVAPGKGVSTAMLFRNGIETKLGSPALEGLDRPLNEDIPDLVANPQIAHFFNTDCISCHTESARRKDLGIAGGDRRFRYSPPKDISGVEPSALPQSKWNVRNFGWFPRRGNVAATVTMRTANETAEAADFVNREYLGHGR